MSEVRSPVTTIKAVCPDRPVNRLTPPSSPTSQSPPTKPRQNPNKPGCLSPAATGTLTLVHVAAPPPSPTPPPPHRGVRWRLPGSRPPPQRRPRLHGGERQYRTSSLGVLLNSGFRRRGRIGVRGREGSGEALERTLRRRLRGADRSSCRCWIFDLR